MSFSLQVIIQNLISSPVNVLKCSSFIHFLLSSDYFKIWPNRTEKVLENPSLLTAYKVAQCSTEPQACQPKVSLITTLKLALYQKKA